MGVARRIGVLVIVLAIAATGCTDAATAPPPERDSTTQTATAEALDGVGEAAQQRPEMRLLPDPERWVVVEDWSERVGEVFGGGRSDVVVAPLDQGIPVLSKQVSLLQFPSEQSDLEERFGDRASRGEPTVIDIVGGGEAWIESDDRSIDNSGIGWTTGIAIGVSAFDPDVALDEFFASLQLVDAATWDDAIGQASTNVETAVAAAIEDLPPLEDRVAPLPHFVLPEPWRLTQVTDKTIWTDEQRAQEAGLVAAASAGSDHVVPLGTRMDFFVSATGDASAPFLAAAWVAISEHAEPILDSAYPGDEPVSGLGLDGYFQRRGGAAADVSLGVGSTTWVSVSTSTIGAAGIEDFLAQAAFASGDPLDGLSIDPDRYQHLDLGIDVDFLPPSWHALWEHPDGDDASISVWRMNLGELRAWLGWRDYRPPLDENWDATVWRTVAARGLIDLGRGMTYDVDQGLLFALQDIARSDLVAIDLDDWIELAAPLNADPLRPR